MLPVLSVARAHSPGVRWPDLEVDRSYPSSADVSKIYI
jgi:hypothetical protein